ncbi:MAG TPA: hypothetical protein ENH56_06655 [Roseobacter sp.]|uniref:Thioredoxin-like fold domain-containing protein n=1 Tax=marine sediment metagenome TaxID=412755 RepID=A0A0F9T217_9ZZZZ|nr:hypothetical protein [Roseobacter sp.]
MMINVEKRTNHPSCGPAKVIRTGARSRAKTALTLIMLMGTASISHAQDYSWKEGFAGCTGTSPFIETLISKTDSDVRPLLKIGEMQAWAIKDENGNPATALTTEDGLTIVGRIVGPQGEDITAALLATVPDPNAKLPIDQASLAHTSNTAVTSQANTTTPEPTTQDAITPPRNLQTTAAAPTETISTALSQLQTNLQAEAPTQAAPLSNTTTAETPAEAIASAPITAVEQPSALVQEGIDTIFKQAGEERIWFSAGTPNPGAPVVYMLADPECPHCQWTIDQMLGPITSGSIDLRIIPAPITGVQGFNSSLSILHSQDIPQTFMAHMTSHTRGTAAVAQMDATQADKTVVQGIVDNINWMRANKMPGVPFFLYETDQGAQFAFSELPTNILSVAKAASQ